MLVGIGKKRVLLIRFFSGFYKHFTKELDFYKKTYQIFTKIQIIQKIQMYVNVNVNVNVYMVFFVERFFKPLLRKNER